MARNDEPGLGVLALGQPLPFLTKGMNDMQKRSIVTTLGLALISTSAFAGPDCNATEATMPMWEVVKAFEEGEGGKVVVAKVTDDNCYEIYGRVGETKLEIYYDPATGVVLEREED